MRSSYGQVSFAILISTALLLTGCHSQPKESGPQYILLTYNNGTCQQNGDSSIVELDPNEAVIYQAGGVLRQFQVQFQTCPFASCPIDSPNGSSINVGRASTGTAGKTFNYTNMTLNHERCLNGNSMGVRVKAGQ